MAAITPEDQCTNFVVDVFNGDAKSLKADGRFYDYLLF